MRRDGRQAEVSERRSALPLWLGVAIGGALCFVGAIGVYDLEQEEGERVGWLGNYVLLAPALATSGVLVLWAAWLWFRRATPARLKNYGIRLGLLGLALLVLPTLFAYLEVAGGPAEGGILVVVAFIRFGEPGACMLLFSLVLLALGGTMS